MKLESMWCWNKLHRQVCGLTELFSACLFVSPSLPLPHPLSPSLYLCFYLSLHLSISLSLFLSISLSLFITLSLFISLNFSLALSLCFYLPLSPCDSLSRTPQLNLPLESSIFTFLSHSYQLSFLPLVLHHAAREAIWKLW